MKHRSRGMTLVELLVAISVSSVIMCVCGVLLHGMYRADKETRLGIAADASVARFSLQFRRDAHAASQVSALPDADGKSPGFAFRGAGSRAVEYRWHDPELVRTVTESDQVVQRDSFRFGPAASVTWQLPPPGSPIVTVQIWQEPPRGAKLDPILRQRVEAAVGSVDEGRREP